MKFRRTVTAGLAATAIAAGLTTATTLAPASGPTSALAPSSAQAADAPTPQVQVFEENGVNGPAVANAINQISTEDRGEFVSKAVSAAFDNDEGDYNVVMMNLSQGYDKGGLEGTHLYANVTWGSIRYGLWIVDAGTFKNTGDGGYINWGFQGWYDRPDDGTVVFKRP